MEENKKDKEQTAESGWNLSQASIELVARLMDSALLHYTNGNLVKSFHKWKSIKFVVGSRFEDSEIQELRDIEMNVAKSFLPPTNEFGDNKNKVDVGLYSFYLEEYITRLNSLFRKYKLDISDKQQKTRLS